MPSTAGADAKTAAEAMNGKYQSSIVIDGLRIMARHGVLPQETTVGNMFEVSVKLDFDAAGAMRADNFGLTVSYAEVIELIKQEMSVPSKLLENAVRRIWMAITRRYPEVSGGEIALYKLQPPVSAELKRAGFVYRW